jgi:histidinol dehydrogenase
MKVFSASDPLFQRKLSAFIREEGGDAQIRETVATILEEVRTRGDRAVIEYTHKFDGFRSRPSELRVDIGEIKAGERTLTREERHAIKEAIRCVTDFHRQSLPKSWVKRNPHGAKVGENWYPLGRVGIYIPAGNVPLVSTAVMTIPIARLAGVRSIAVFTPAGRDGRVSPQMLAGLSLCGATEVYRVGGAQAIAAMAFGTRSIAPVDKVMGPGNAFVAEAQRQVFGKVGIDLLPGPSEAMLIMDQSARVEWVAADLLAQAEHGSGRERLYLVHADAKLAEAVCRAVEEQIPRLRHAAAVRKVWATRAAVIQVESMDQAVEVANHIAPEHLELHLDKTERKKCIKGIRTAGAILVGHDTPTVIGDFTAGPSHTLPTARTGRFFSGLKVTDFMRRSSIVEYDAGSLAKARQTVRVFSNLENLDAHGRSMEIRFE